MADATGPRTPPQRPAPAKTPLQLRLTGAAALLPAGGGERPLDPQGALIAARLALAGPQPRSLLATWLWPDAEPARARANLRQRLLRLKALAGGDWIVGGSVLQLAPGVVLLPPDAAPGAELLEGVAGVAAEAGAAWLQQARAERRTRQLQALAREALAAENAQRLPDAVAAVRGMVAIEPHTEAHRRQLLRLHYLAHDMAAARRTHQELVRMLRDEFDAEPDTQTRELFALVEQARPVPARAAAPSGGPLGAALQRPPRLVGRGAELALLAQALQARAAVLVLGEAGMGKSRLLAELLHGRGDVVAAKAEAGDAPVPYATLGRLLRAVLRHDGRPAPPALRPLLPEPGDGLGAHTAHAALPLRAAVAPLFETGALAAVVVDDLHFADDASLEMLQALAAAAPGGPAAPPAWLFAQRTAEGSAAAERLRDSLVAARRLSVLTLRPLDVAQMAELLDSLAWPGPDTTPSAAGLVQLTGGNPLFVLEALKHRASVGRGEGDGTGRLLPVNALIERRLQRLSGRALALARTAAVAGPDFGAELAAAVLARPVVELADAWAELEAAQVLRGTSFAHDLVLEAARRSLPPAVAQPLHAAVASWLQAHGGEPARVAAHWLQAGQPRQAAPWLLQAADRAHRQLRPREEAGFLAQLVECVEADDPAQAVDALLRLVRVQTEAEGFAAGAALLQRALHLVHDDARRVRLLNLMAETQLNQLLPAASAPSAAQALQLARANGDDGAAAEALVRWHRALCMAGRSAQAEALWQAHQAWMARVPLPSAELESDRGWVLDRLGRVRESRVWHQRALDRARASGRPVDEAVVLGNLAQSFLLGGEPAAAEDAIAAAEALGTRHDGLHPASDYLAYQRAVAASASGRYGHALAHLERALADTASQSPQARLAVLCQRALLWAAIGQRGRAQADASQVLAEADSAVVLRLQAHHAMALATQASGQPLQQGLQRALDALGDATQLALDAPIRLRLLLAEAAANPASAAAGLARARGLLRQARAGGQDGLRWSAHWTAAQLAVAAGRPCAARRHAAACGARPAGMVAPQVSEGAWWHGLWRVWLALGEDARAQAAREAGRAWVGRTRQQHLPEAFQARFVEVIPEYRELLGPP